MGREPKNTTINGTFYEVMPLGALKGRSVFVRLLKMFGPLFAGDIAAGLDHLSEDDFNYLCDVFAEYTNVRINEKQMPVLKDVFDGHFSGKYLDMLQWLAFCVQVNFGDFYKGLGKVADSAATDGKAPDQLRLFFQKAATGTAGG